MHDFILFGTGDGNRTHTNITAQGSLSPSCLPIPTPLHLGYISTCQRTWYFNIVMKYCYIQNYFWKCVGVEWVEHPETEASWFTVNPATTYGINSQERFLLFILFIHSYQNYYRGILVKENFLLWTVAIVSLLYRNHILLHSIRLAAVGSGWTDEHTLSSVFYLP